MLAHSLIPHAHLILLLVLHVLYIISTTLFTSAHPSLVTAHNSCISGMNHTLSRLASIVVLWAPLCTRSTRSTCPTEGPYNPQDFLFTCRLCVTTFYSGKRCAIRTYILVSHLGVGFECDVLSIPYPSIIIICYRIRVRIRIRVRLGIGFRVRIRARTRYDIWP